MPLFDNAEKIPITFEQGCTTVLQAKCCNNFTIEIVVMHYRVFAMFEFQINFGKLSYIATTPMIGVRFAAVVADFNISTFCCRCGWFRQYSESVNLNPVLHVCRTEHCFQPKIRIHTPWLHIAMIVYVSDICSIERFSWNAGGSYMHYRVIFGSVISSVYVILCPVSARSRDIMVLYRSLLGSTHIDTDSAPSW